MASLGAAQPVSKSEFFEALSKKDGASESFAGTFKRLDDELEDYPGDESLTDELQNYIDASDESGQELEAFARQGKLLGGAGETPDEEVSERQGPAAARPGPGGIWTNNRSNVELQSSLADQSFVKRLEKLRQILAAKAAAADDAMCALDIEEQRLRALRKQAEQGQLADPGRLGYQEKEVARAWERLTVAEGAREAADLFLFRASEGSEQIRQKTAQEHSEASQIARARQAAEVKRARRLISAGEAAEVLHQEEVEARALEASMREAAARAEQPKGVRRLAEAQAVHSKRWEEIEEVRESRLQHDAQRVLTLKQNVDGINRQIQSQNERRKKKFLSRQKEHNERKNELLNQGQNPYEVWRREEMEGDKEKQKHLLKLQNELRSEKLLEQLALEDKLYRQKLKNDTVLRHEAEEFQRQMGNYAKEKKIVAYIRKMTIGNVDVLDPTGTALRIDPSKVTVQKTMAFGLGWASADEINKVEREVRKAKTRMANWQQEEPDEANGLGPEPPGHEGPDDADDDVMSSASAANDRPRRVQPMEDMGSSMNSLTEEAREDGKLWVPKLTMLEEQYLAAARERQKQNITSVQRCWGKEFKGDAFLAKPSIIAFNDFEVGQRYRQVVEVTNVSLTFNQFKLLPMDDKVKDFFEVIFVPPGRMSAGVTRYITIWFCPKVNKDIVSTFPILAKTGRIDFPLRCTTKKTILTMTPQDADANPIIDFGQVLSGEHADRALQVKNTGALPANFMLELESPDDNMLSMLSWTPEHGEFTANGLTRVNFTFKPTALGSFSTVLRLKIANGAAGDGNLDDQKLVQVRGSCLDVPIYVDHEEYDLQTCVYGHTFRESVVVHNRQSVAMKIHVVEPKTIEGELQLNTALAYIQGHKDQAIQIKFSPKDNFLIKNPQFKDAQRPEVHGAFRIPMKIIGGEQVLPVCTALIGILTENNIFFEPPLLAFGRCFVGSSAACRLTIVNESQLSQRFAFLRLPSFLSVQDMPLDVLTEEKNDQKSTGTAVLDGGADGTIGLLLPNERRVLCVTYSPDTATEINYSMELKAITGELCVRDFKVECTGQGIAPMLSLSHTQVDMASIPCNATSTESVVITNVSRQSVTMNVLMPPAKLAALHISPLCITLAPKQSQRLQIEFQPTKDYLMQAGNEGDAEEQVEERKAEKDQCLLNIRDHGGRRWQSSAGGTIHSSWKLSICMRLQQEVGAKAKTSSIYLGVQTCVLPSVLSVEPAVLDFGEVTAQQRTILPLMIHNVGDPGMLQDLHMEALPENQCFTVLNACRSVGSKPFSLMVEFKPQLVQIYQSTLQLRTQNTRVQVPLRGRGVRPVLKIEPANGVIHMGSVVYSKEAKDYNTQLLTIKNESPFELHYKLEFLLRADPNHKGVPPFALSPATGTVAANGSRTVTVTFRPHRPMLVFREKVLVNVPNQREPTYVYLYGHSFKYQAFALTGMDFGPFGTGDGQGGRVSAFVDSLAVGCGSTFSSSSKDEFEYPRAQQKQFSLVFEHGQSVQYLLVGACVPPGTPSAPQTTPAVTYDFQILPSEHSSFFAVEAPEGSKPDKQVKGAVQPGKPAMNVAFRYTPPADTSLTYGGVNLALLGGIGQWITCKARGILAGGFVPPGEPPNSTQEITVELRAYLQQI